MLDNDEELLTLLLDVPRLDDVSKLEDVPRLDDDVDDDVEDEDDNDEDEKDDEEEELKLLLLDEFILLKLLDELEFNEDKLLSDELL
ncbi:MAG: hypothetical protein GF411_00380 [Candidatus Lokiarchaeota archaeon]|nr:hypothetical protein [Candidatus Lokiarchaeota archaeon]